MIALKPSLTLLFLLSLRESTAFTIHSQLRKTTPPTPSFPTTILNNCQSDDQIQGGTKTGQGQGQRQRLDINIQQRLHKFGEIVVKRSDTLRCAGFYEQSGGVGAGEHKEPLTAGAKTNLTLFLLALGYKWYRSIFINKMAIWERQPQWNTVITSKEDEEKAKLEALTCNNCGATIFIAKGRKWFQMPRGYECYCCGASGNENFQNTRNELLEEIDDDYFDYEKPLDFVTAAERRKLMKEAGGDEEKAVALLTQQAEKGGDAAVEGRTEEAIQKKRKKGNKKNMYLAANGEPDENEISDSKSAGDKKKQSDDEIDLLDMD